jgi:hypothetical protein
MMMMMMMMMKEAEGVDERKTKTFWSKSLIML